MENELLHNKHINNKAKICSIICLLFFLFAGVNTKNLKKTNNKIQLKNNLDRNSHYCHNI